MAGAVHPPGHFGYRRVDNHHYRESKKIMEPLDEPFTPEEEVAWQAFAQALPNYTLDDLPHPDIYTFGVDRGAGDDSDEDDGVITVTYRGATQ